MKFPRALVVLSIVALAAGCSSGESLPILKLGTSTDARNAAGGEIATDAPLYVGPGRTYTTSVTDWGDAGSAHEQKWPTWTFTAPTKGADTKKALLRVASAFGLAGDVTAVAGTDGAWSLVDKRSGLSLESYGDDHMRQWSVFITDSRGMTIPDCPPGAECAVVAPDGTSSSKTPTIPSSQGTSESDARSSAEQILRAIGVDTSPDALGWTTSRDDYGTYVSAMHVFRGRQTQMTWNFTYGADKELLNASGPMFTLVESDAYPIVDIPSAIDRLNKGVGMMYGALRVAESNTKEKSSAEIVAAEVSVAPWWLANGTSMLLPAYVFTLADSSTVSVIAVPDKYIEFPGTTSVDTIPVPDTGGGSSGSGGSTPPSPGASSGSSSGSAGTAAPAVPLPPSPISVKQARVLIGLTLDEGQKVCDSNGWTLRIASMDGETRFLTTDFQFDRVNVAIVKGLITEVSVG